MLSYRIKKSILTGGPYPALILIHGYGSNMDDLFSFSNYLPEQYTIISLQAPLESPFGGGAWYSINFDSNMKKWSDDREALTSIGKIKDQLDYFTSTYELNSEDISLMGFSQGAILSWSIGIEHPDLIKNIIPLSGFYHPEITSNNLNFKFRLNCFSSHGINDEVIPIDWARRGIQILDKKNINIEFNEYQSGHEISKENLRDVIKWLNKN